jgi:anti-anti-sigma factor
LFKDFAEEMSQQGFCDFIVDLSACKTMDSTFLGVLVGFLNEHPTGQTRLTLVNISEYHRTLLDNLGISRILTIKSSSFMFPSIITKTLQEEYYDPRKRMEMIRSAHKALVALNDKNRKLFQEFLDLMDEENPPARPRPGKQE